MLRAPWLKQNRRPFAQAEEAVGEGGSLAAIAGRLLDPGHLAKRRPTHLEPPAQAPQLGGDNIDAKALGLPALEIGGPRPHERLLERPRELLDGLTAVYGSVITSRASAEPRKAYGFQAVREPLMSVGDYLARLRTHCQCSDAVFVASLVYIDRAVKRQPDFEVSNLTIHRLLAASIVIGAKFLDDIYYTNAYYAKGCGLSVRELNKLEEAMLRLIDWRLVICPEEFDKYSAIVLGKLREEPTATAGAARAA